MRQHSQPSATAQESSCLGVADVRIYPVECGCRYDQVKSRRSKVGFLEGPYGEGHSWTLLSGQGDQVRPGINSHDAMTTADEIDCQLAAATTDLQGVASRVERRNELSRVAGAGRVVGIGHVVEAQTRSPIHGE